MPWTKGDPVPGKTTTTIDRERRDALYELVLDHLSGIGDFWIAIEEKDFAKAERLAQNGSVEPVSPVNVLSDNANGAAPHTRPAPGSRGLRLMSISQDTSAPMADPGCGDKRRLRKTKTPGVFKRVDGAGRAIGYVSVFRSVGRQRKRHARTYEEAKRIKRESETDRDRGELQERTTIGFLRYVDEWVERYRGQGRRGFRESTREEYRRLIRAYAHRHFPRKLKLADVSTTRWPASWIGSPTRRNRASAWSR